MPKASTARVEVGKRYEFYVLSRQFTLIGTVAEISGDVLLLSDINDTGRKGSIVLSADIFILDYVAPPKPSEVVVPN